MPRGRKRKPGRRAKGTGSIHYRESDGRYAACVQLGYEGGRRRRVYFYARTEAECVEWLNEKLHQQKQGKLRAPSRQSVQSFLLSWLADVVKPNRRPKTYEAYEAICRRHLIPELGSTRLDALTGRDVAAMLARLGKAGLSRATVTLALSVLKSALSVAVRWGLIAANPATGVEPPKLDSASTEVLDAGQVRALLESIRGDRWEALWALALSTGLRRGELLGLRWEDIDLDTGHLEVKRQLQRIAGGGLVLRETKSATGARVVALPADTVAVLRAHRLQQKKERAAAGQWDDSGHVFTNSRGGALEPVRVGTLFHRALANAGLPPVPFQALRRTHATQLAEAGIPDAAISRRLGHAGVEVTNRHYIRATDPMDRQAADVWDRLAGSG